MFGGRKGGSIDCKLQILYRRCIASGYSLQASTWQEEVQVTNGERAHACDLPVSAFGLSASSRFRNASGNCISLCSLS